MVEGRMKFFEWVHDVRFERVEGTAEEGKAPKVEGTAEEGKAPKVKGAAEEGKAPKVKGAAEEVKAPKMEVPFVQDAIDLADAVYPERHEPRRTIDLIEAFIDHKRGASQGLVFDDLNPTERVAKGQTGFRGIKGSMIGGVEWIMGRPYALYDSAVNIPGRIRSMGSRFVSNANYVWAGETAAEQERVVIDITSEAFLDYLEKGIEGKEAVAGMTVEQLEGESRKAFIMRRFRTYHELNKITFATGETELMKLLARRGVAEEGGQTSGRSHVSRTAEAGGEKGGSVTQASVSTTSTTTAETAGPEGGGSTTASTEAAPQLTAGEIGRTLHIGDGNFLSYTVQFDGASTAVQTPQLK